MENTTFINRLKRLFNAETIFENRVYLLNGFYILVTSKNIFVFDNDKYFSNEGYTFVPNKAIAVQLLNTFWRYDNYYFAIAAFDKRTLRFDVENKYVTFSLSYLLMKKAEMKPTHVFNNYKDIFAHNTSVYGVSRSALGTAITPLFDYFNRGSKSYYVDMFREFKSIPLENQVEDFRVEVYIIKENNFEVFLEEVFFKDSLVSQSLSYYSDENFGKNRERVQKKLTFATTSFNNKLSNELVKVFLDGYFKYKTNSLSLNNTVELKQSIVVLKD